ncbi:MAG: hypothetical protein ACR2PL_26380, partial [Dehalococcoidia bacterium]
RYLDTAVTTTADVSLGDDAIEIHGAATRPDSGQFTFSILAWRHGCVLLYVMTQAPPGEEPATLLAPLAQALDTHYLGNPVPSSSVCAG